jgi:hypothetical protein
VRGGQSLEVEKLRNHQRLLVARDVLVSSFARNLRADGEIVAGDFKGHVLWINPGQRHVNPPAIIRRVDLEGRRRTSSSPRGRIAPELVEEAIHLALKIEDIIERIPTGESEHGVTSFVQISTRCLFTCQVH